MKQYIEHVISCYGSAFPHPNRVVEHLFATNGNGVELDHKGYIRGHLPSKEAYSFPEPKAFEWIYPWSDNERFQPFRDLAGCNETGFQETALYFIECIKVTPDNVENIDKWKENLHIVEDVLLNTPKKEIRYKDKGDIKLFLEDIKGSERTSGTPKDVPAYQHENSVYKIWFFNVQWSDCPEYVEKEVHDLWCDYGLSNDNSMWKSTLNNELFEKYPRIYFWMKHKGVKEEEPFIVHWWW